MKPPEERLLDLLDRMGRLQLRRGPFKNIDITMPQAVLMFFVAKSPGCHVQDIAEGLGLTAPTVSVGVRRLEEIGMLERQPDPQDGRATRIFLTDQAQTIHKQARLFQHKSLRSFLSGLETDEQVQLIDLLDKAINQAENREIIVENP